MSQPQLKTSNVVAQINSLPSGFDFEGLEARRILREIRSLRDASPSDSFMLEGMLNALAWRSETAVSCFEKAKYFPHNNSLLENYALSLSFLSLHDKALEIYRDLIVRGLVSNKSDLAFGLWCAAAAVDVDSYIELEQIYNKFVAERSDYSSDDVSDKDPATLPCAVKVIQMGAVTKFMKSVVRFVDGHNIDRGRLKEIVGLAGSVANENKVRFSSVDSSIDNFYGEEVLHVRFLVDDLSSRIHHLNEQFLDRFLDNESLSSFGNNIVASFNYGKV